MNKKNAILVVEDNHDLRVCMRQVLEDAGFLVLSSTNGKDALRLIKKGPAPKVIILDLNMPIMSGEDFLKTVTSDKDIPTIPTLIMSGDKEKLCKFKNYSQLLKPIDSSELIASIDATLETSAQSV